MLVVINAGHCPGVDSGACGDYSQEANIVKYVGEVVCKDLEAVGIQALFVQDDSLSNVCGVANDADADLFVSIHCNSAANRTAKGTETFFYEGSANSKKLAQCIQNQLVDTMKSVDRGLKNGDWLYVLKHTTMPAVLTELGFISNPAEEKYLNEHKQVIAHAVARGITDYMQ